MKLLRRVFSLPVLLCATLAFMAALGLACVAAGVFLLSPPPAALEARSETTPQVTPPPASEIADDASLDTDHGSAQHDVAGKTEDDGGEAARTEHAETDVSRAPVPDADEVVFLVPPGSSFHGAAQRLQGMGLIRDAQAFLLLVRLTETGGDLKAGEFLLPRGKSPLTVLSRLTRGQPILHRLQVREGLTWWETGRLVEEAGLGSFESFERAVHDRALLDAHGVPFDSAEGFLFPETYFLPRPHDDDAKPVVEAMLREFGRAASLIWPEGRPGSDELARLVILASIVERETGQPHERRRVAGVYANRLRIGMLLQADPTIIYGLGPDFEGRLRRRHLDDRNNPYNTYQRGGLPPGPICSPGFAALAAAVDPEEHRYFYFVSRMDGTHHFSTNLEEHNRAVRRYILNRR